jgi:malate dehydrogenase
MDIAIIGANGDVGRALAVQIISRQLLTPRQRLQLVGRREGGSASALHGFRADLYDAFAEITPEIDVALTPEEVAADLIVFCAGATAPTGNTRMMGRHELALTNRGVFESYAKVLAQRGHGEELVIIVTNPVELGVEVFSRYLDPHRVLGMGAYQDTMRMRREIATEFGVKRQRVHGYMLGEHGDALVPILSHFWIYGFDDAENARALKRLRGDRHPGDFAASVLREKAVLAALLARSEVELAFRHAESQPPDLRAVLLPLVTHIAGAKTAVSTAAVTAEMVEQILGGGQSVIPAQIKLEADDWFGPAGVLGVPVICGLRGWSQVIDLDIDDEERDCLLASATTIRERLASWGQA